MIMEKQRIAIVGAGISGLTAAYLLQQRHDIELFEANDYAGGHTHTVSASVATRNGRQDFMVDTGFIVCNDRNYPNFLRLMQGLGVELQATEMSFSVRNPVDDLEYNGHNLDTLFAQRSNLLKPRFLRFVIDILRFNKAAKARLASGPDDLTLDDFLVELRLSSDLRDNYLLPMVAAIWSCSVQQAGKFPLRFFLRFFLNHGLLDVKNRPQWYVVKGGSQAYVAAMMKGFAGRVHLATPVRAVSRTPNGVSLTTKERTREFDHVILACHSDQSLRLIDDASARERAILAALEYQNNDVLLHHDAALMPARKKAWASWNFLTAGKDSASLPVVTYSMNILQGIGSIHDPEPLLVSLNAAHLVDPDKILGRFTYAHPVYSSATEQAQQSRGEICGRDRIHFCGAYWYNGFHEDGVRSALDVCSRFGVELE